MSDDQEPPSALELMLRELMPDLDSKVVRRSIFSWAESDVASDERDADEPDAEKRDADERR